MKTDITKPSLQKDIYYATLFEWATRESKWLINRSFAPGGWAVDFCYLYVMYRALNAAKPMSIIEYGLGQTTRMLSQYSVNSNDIVIPMLTIEHDIDWVNFYNDQLDSNIPRHLGTTFDLFTDCTYELNGRPDVTIKGVNLYSDKYYEYVEEYVRYNGKVQFVSVDAPFGTSPYSRVHLLDFLNYSWLDTNHFVIMVDDMEREGEQNTVKLFLSELKRMGVHYHKKIYSGEKPHMIIVSDDLRFLCTM